MAPGPATGPGAPARLRGALAALATTVIGQLRLVGSRCCVGQADAAWRRTIGGQAGPHAAGQAGPHAAGQSGADAAGRSGTRAG